MTEIISHLSPITCPLFRDHYNRSHDRLKVLYWHFNGFCILQKRLEKGRFVLPKFKEEMAKLEVTSYQLQGLIQGLSCWQGQEARRLSYRYT